MNGFQSKNTNNMEQQFPGCLGRVVNLFDLSPGAVGNKLLTDKPDCDGSSLTRSRSDVARMLNLPFGDQIEDKMIVSELNRSSSNKKANGTPMKKLIAQEMLKEVESKYCPPNLVAKLMGLDNLPHQQLNSAAEKVHPKGYYRHSLSHSGSLAEWDQVNEFRNGSMHSEVHQFLEQNECKDVYEILQHSQKTNYGRDNSPQKGRLNDNINEKKMALVRQKFTEAKRLATDEKLRQSKEFQEALEVLSSNRDLFLKFLQEPNSLFSQNLYDLQSIPPPSETNRITVLKPSKGVENDKFAGSRKKNDTLAKKPALQGQATGLHKSPAHSPISTNMKVGEYPAQPTRIVVLKPSHGKNHDTLTSPKVLHGEDFYEAPEDEESRELAREITVQMRENMMGHCRDETLLSSLFSNGYVGDDSSFNKSENECVVENLSDSEVMSPTSRHSWDYINRFGSPYSFSSSSRVSCSPESSVCREAKKRLSERWALMALNGGLQEQRHARRSSSTLGEMLALSDAKKAVRSEEVVGEEQEPRGSTSGLVSDSIREEGVSDFPKGLLRSKSLPVSSTIYDARKTVEVPDLEPDKTQVPKELTKAKSTKSSFKGKVSSFFFLGNKKSGKETLGHAHSPDKSQSASPKTLRSPEDLPGKMISDDMALCVKSSSHDGCLSPGLHGFASKSSSAQSGMGKNRAFIYLGEGLSVAKPVMRGCATENHDQPSPISVLEPPFEEDDPTNLESSRNMKADQQVLGLPQMTNLIDKSPPIESIARTLSWDDSCANTGPPSLLKPSLVSPGTEEEEEEDWHLFVETLLSGASLNIEVQSDTFLGRWHSPETPLDPSLRDKYADLNEKEPVHEAKRRQRRSIRKLVFDRVNNGLVEITGYGPDSSRREMSRSMAQGRFIVGASPMVVEQVWDLMKEWFSSERSCFLGDCGDSDSLVVERVVRNEVGGKGWAEHLMLELDNIGIDVGGKLLEELVEEAVVDLTNIV